VGALQHARTPDCRFFTKKRHFQKRSAKVFPRCNRVTVRTEKSAWRSGKTRELATIVTLHRNTSATSARSFASQPVALQHVDSALHLLHLLRAADFFSL
jgi:uncharacterized protein (DUF924 family)